MNGRDDNLTVQCQENTVDEGLPPSQVALSFFDYFSDMWTSIVVMEIDLVASRAFSLDLIGEFLKLSSIRTPSYGVSFG